MAADPELVRSFGGCALLSSWLVRVVPRARTRTATAARRRPPPTRYGAVPLAEAFRVNEARAAHEIATLLRAFNRLKAP